MDETTAHDTLRAKGRAVMHEVLGQAYMEKRDAGTNPFNAAVRRLSEEFAYATLWERPGLNRRERSLITLAMISALNRPVAALNNGCTAEEISEIFTHSVAYCGFPSAIDALRVAEEVLREQGKL
jgi:4-carboxymuconolactone decarboxylase